jgi:hypothetical protein
VASAFLAWRHLLKEAKRQLEVLSSIASKWLQRDLHRAIMTWRFAFKDLTRRWALLRHSVSVWRNLELSLYFNKWSENVNWIVSRRRLLENLLGQVCLSSCTFCASISDVMIYQVHPWHSALETTVEALAMSSHAACTACTFGERAWGSASTLEEAHGILESLDAALIERLSWFDAQHVLDKHVQQTALASTQPCLEAYAKRLERVADRLEVQSPTDGAERMRLLADRYATRRFQRECQRLEQEHASLEALAIQTVQSRFLLPNSRTAQVMSSSMVSALSASSISEFKASIALQSKTLAAALTAHMEPQGVSSSVDDVVQFCTHQEQLDLVISTAQQLLSDERKLKSSAMEQFRKQLTTSMDLRSDVVASVVAKLFTLDSAEEVLSAVSSQLAELSAPAHIGIELARVGGSQINVAGIRDELSRIRSAMIHFGKHKSKVIEDEAAEFAALTQSVPSVADDAESKLLHEIVSVARQHGSSSAKKIAQVLC